MEQQSIIELVQKSLKDALRERGHVNVLIAGRTGVGKSTLINAVFQGHYATTGQGRPVTQNTRAYTKEDIPLTIFDTRGLELADYEETFQSLERLILERQQDVDPNRHIHVAWICIQEPGRRVEEAEIELQNLLHRAGIPIVGVITKAMSDQGFKAEVQNLLPKTKNIVRVNSLETVLDGGYRIPPLGLSELVHITMECVPEGHRRAFVAAQKASIDQKVHLSHGIVATAVAASGVIGAQPIPFADAFLLVPTQVGMITGITVTFGLQLTEGFISALVASAAGTAAATFGGRALVTNLIKLIPGGGSIVGGAISAATAIAVTTVFGKTYIETLRFLYEKNNGENPSPEEVSELFAEKLKKATYKKS